MPGGSDSKESAHSAADLSSVLDGNENITMGNDVRMGGYSLYTNGGDVNCGGGKMYASRFYVGTNRYIYLDGTTLKYNDNGTVKTIVLS